MWLVESVYSVWGHQNDLHVVTLMKRHTLRPKCFPGSESELKFHVRADEESKKQKLEMEKKKKQLHGTFNVLTWNSNRYLIQNEAKWQTNQ